MRSSFVAVKRLRTAPSNRHGTRALYENPSCTLDEAREAVTTLEDVERTSRRVLGGAHPFTKTIERHLQALRAALRARLAREAVSTN
jgi:hypothetical protein